jgi:hypothetical protein
MVFDATFNDISAILWWLVLLVEENWVPGENHKPVASHWQTLCCIEYTSPWTGFELTTLLAIAYTIGTDCTGSCKSNYHTITTVPIKVEKVRSSYTLLWKTEWWRFNSVSVHCNLVEIRIPKKFSVCSSSLMFLGVGIITWCNLVSRLGFRGNVVCIPIPISSQVLSKVFWNFKI